MSFPTSKKVLGGMFSDAGKRRWFAARNLLVVGQLAFLWFCWRRVVCSSEVRLEAAGVDPGFRMDRSLLVELDAGLIGYEEPQGLRAYSDLVERLQSLPGVEHAGIAVTVPFGNVRLGERVRPAGGAPAMNRTQDDRPCPPVSTQSERTTSGLSMCR